MQRFQRLSSTLLVGKLDKSTATTLQCSIFGKKAQTSRQLNYKHKRPGARRSRLPNASATNAAHSLIARAVKESRTDLGGVLH